MKNLDDDALALVARYFAALSVPMRLRILRHLRDGERNVGEITAATGCTQANVSKHLAVLAQCGLVAKTQRGTSAYYHFADETVYRLCDLVCTQLDRRFTEQAAQRRAVGNAARAAGQRGR
ncbi:metalloregulator ArsR/SmtB family transcription factor [Ramlibacter sp.]|uniref:ArsR/SmtB family transcription factor n=1 Tax=Ramlibacter sp. TaxID=1917967 RepID=UPI002CF51775|nr:metalloregulator ArsR/SmtB family transcription factor [Ramlibacter sp.]HWI82308.1 metalloregulator ArsR/SmtB family transcription factor [Ramlibacter sp.]